jgi:hypothetical protein
MAVQPGRLHKAPDGGRTLARQLAAYEKPCLSTHCPRTHQVREVVGKQVEYAGMDIFRVDAGKIVEYWLCADILQLLQQVGVIPS